MSAGASEGGEDSDFELNLAPIIDCFTVLITYMLVSASFISLNVLDIQVAQSSTAPAEEMPLPTELPTTLSLRLTTEKGFELKIGGKDEATFAVAAQADGSWDLATLNRRMDEIKGKWTTVSEMSVKADPTVKYKEIVKVIETLKPKMPKIFLGE